MRFLIPIISAIFFRASGWGKDDYFAPIIPLKMPQNRLLQLIIGKLREIGIQPDILIARTEKPISKKIKEKTFYPP